MKLHARPKQRTGHEAQSSISAKLTAYSLTSCVPSCVYIYSIKYSEPSSHLFAPSDFSEFLLLQIWIARNRRHSRVRVYFLLSLYRASWYHQSPSFTNRRTSYQSYKPLKFTLKLKSKLLLHVSFYDHHQGAYN